MNKWLPSEIKWRSPRILADLFPVLDDVADRESRLVDGMQRSRAWCGIPPGLGVVDMVGTRNFTCYMGAL